MVKRKFTSLVLAFLMAAVAAGAASKGAEEKGREIDSGVFVVTVNGQQVATETFRIEQGNAFSTITSEFRAEAGPGKSAFRSVLQLLPTGELKHYEWHEISPGKAVLAVDPADGLIYERITPNLPDKPSVQPLLLPLTTMVLDDYAFSHREVLAWRYLAQACNGELKDCRPPHADFGVLVPQQRSSMLVSVDFAGLDKITLRGVERQLNRIDLKAEEINWSLWLDADLKVVRIVIPGEKTEIVRR